MTKITSIKSYQVLDSRGFPTVAVSVELNSGTVGTAMVPSGASTGEHEALELRDGDKSKYNGKGVLKAISNVNEILAPALQDKDASHQRELDELMMNLDGTTTKSKLGANAILGVSMAAAVASANEEKLPLFQYLSNAGFNTSIPNLLPTPLVNVINGGAHAANSLDFQEIMLVPQIAGSFSDNIRACSEIFHTLKKNLQKQKLSTGVGDEGGFAPDLPTADAALQCLVDASTDAGYQPGGNIFFALDVASSELFDKESKRYVFKKSSKESLSTDDMIAYYGGLIKKFPIVSIEDGLDENDWAGWKKLTETIGATTQLVGDDFFVTNTARFAEGIKQGSANAILIKLNQIGTVTETLDVMNLAHKNNYKSVVSHRSGETEDTFISDLSVALNSGQIKTGSVCRGERTAKYNRLLWIENFLGANARFSAPFNKL